MSLSNGIVSYSELTPEEEVSVRGLETGISIIKINQQKYRVGVTINSIGKLAILSLEKEHIKSTKTFKKLYAIYEQLHNNLEKMRQNMKSKFSDDARRLIHNLVSINGHNIQDIHSLIPHEEITRHIKEHEDYVESIVKKDTRETALTLLRIAKNNISMKTEFSVFNKLYEPNPVLSKKCHSLHRSLMNVFYLFFSDFTDKQVRIKLSPTELKGFFDYETVHVAFYYLLENAAKYVKPHSELEVTFEEEKGLIKVVFSMVSLQIFEHELSTILTEGVTGQLAKKLNKEGYGIGMHRINDTLILNESKLVIEPKGSIVEHMGIPFQHNVFTILLPKCIL